jgi:hypothetical protein
MAPNKSFDDPREDVVESEETFEYVFDTRQARGQKITSKRVPQV